MIILKGCGTAIALKNGMNAECPEGGSDVLYFNPAVASATDYKFPLAGEKLYQALRFCVRSSLVNCTEDFLSLASLKITEEIINQVFVSKIYYCNRFLVNPEL